MTEPNHEAPMPHQRSRRPQALAVLSLVLATLCAWGLFQWGPWTSGDNTGQSLAAVPDEICSGLVESEQVKDIQLLRHGGKIEQQLSGALPEGVSCTVGPDEPREANLLVDVRPLRGPLRDWPLDPAFWDELPWRVPFGPGLIGMGSSVSAWLIVPCPDGPYGDLLARADIHLRDSNSHLESYDFPQYQHPLAVLLTHTANTMATRTGCQTARLPEPKYVDPPQGSSSVAGLDSSCVSAASDDGPIPLSANVTASPVRPAPIEACLYEATTRETWFGKPVFVSYRGGLAEYAPPPDLVTAHGKVLIARTVGTCGSEPTVWMAWVEPANLDRGLTAAHDRVVENAVKTNGCTVQQRWVAPEHAAPPPSPPAGIQPGTNA